MHTLSQKTLKFIEMHGTITTKIIDAQQAKLRNTYKNTKLKLLKTNAAIWFNKICKKCALLVTKNFDVYTQFVNSQRC
jgi:hypothetical protein